MTIQLAFSRLSCGSNGSLAHAPAALAGRHVCTRTSPVRTPSPRSIAAPVARPSSIRRSGRRVEFGMRPSLATRVETAFAVAVLIGLAAVESYFIAHAALILRAPPEPHAVTAVALGAVAAAAPLTPLASERVRFSPQSSRLAMLATVGSYVASGLGGRR